MFDIYKMKQKKYHGGDDHDDHDDNGDCEEEEDNHNTDDDDDDDIKYSAIKKQNMKHLEKFKLGKEASDVDINLNLLFELNQV